MVFIPKKCYHHLAIGREVEGLYLHCQEQLETVDNNKYLRIGLQSAYVHIQKMVWKAHKKIGMLRIGLKSANKKVNVVAFAIY